MTPILKRLLAIVPLLCCLVAGAGETNVYFYRFHYVGQRMQWNYNDSASYKRIYWDLSYLYNSQYQGPIKASEIPWPEYQVDHKKPYFQLFDGN